MLFFALFCDLLTKNKKSTSLPDLAKTMLETISTLNKLQAKHTKNQYSSLNTVLTNGQQILATRYTSHPDEPPNSLHYSIGDHVQKNLGAGAMHSHDINNPKSILIASEPINEFPSEWHEVPPNHMLLFNEDYVPQTIPIPP